MNMRILKFLVFGGASWILAIGVTVPQVCTWIVDDDDPGADFTSVQTAINSSVPGFVVCVRCGTYHETITMADGIDVIGEDPACTVLDGGGAGTVVSFAGVGSGTEFSGFTIQNGLSFLGGGIFLDDSNPVISRVAIVGNTAVRGQDAMGYYYGGLGGGMTMQNFSYPELRNILFMNNNAEANGGAVDMFESFPRIVHVTIVGNDAAFFGGGIYAFRSDPTISSSVIFGNSSVVGGGGIDLFESDLTVIEYTDAFQNLPTNIDGTYIPGLGNISVDPLFVSPESHDYCLRSHSPAVDAGPVGVPADAVDFLGRPRLMDGDFDGNPIVDYGYCEGGEITRLTVGPGGVIGWDPSVNPLVVFNLYRSLLSAFKISCAVDCVYTQDPIVVAEARQECDLTTPGFTDLDDPPVGDGYLYNVTGEDLVEGGLGFRSNDIARDNDNPCP